MTSANPRQRLRIAVLTVCALLPLWWLGMMDRGLWTPDEPREADISWNMSRQADRQIPLLAGEPILEKPPLTYWMSGASIHLFGPQPWAMRLPNLLYAIVGTIAVVYLAFAMGGGVCAWVAGIASGTFLLQFQVAVWLATDAAVVSSVCVTLLGLYRGLIANSGTERLKWYLLLSLGATFGVLAKGPIALLVPALALFGIVFWERRWIELRRWELWTCALIPVIAIGAWAVSILKLPDGSEDLRTFFWWNLVGRFAHLNAPTTAQFANGHRNWPAKYLIEAPVYLFPWTFVCLAAFRRCFRAVSVASPNRFAWRFLTCAIVLPLVILSASATARGIYAAPLLIPSALMLGLWAKERLAASDAFDQRMQRWTWNTCVVFVVTVSVCVSGFLLLEGVAAPQFYRIGAALACAAAAATALGFARRQLKKSAIGMAGVATFAAYGLATLSLAAVFPVIDEMQDLSAIGRSIASDTPADSLVLYAPDETTRAFMDMTLGQGAQKYQSVQSAQELSDLLATHAAMVMVKTDGHADGPMLSWARRLGFPVKHAQIPVPIAAALSGKLGFQATAYYGRPDGRQYVLMTRRPAVYNSAQRCSDGHSIATGRRRSGLDGSTEPGPVYAGGPCDLGRAVRTPVENPADTSDPGIPVRSRSAQAVEPGDSEF